MLDDTRRGWKTKARDRCREIIGDLENGELVKGDDAEFLFWLLERHPRAAEKIGQGVAGFSVQSAQMGTRCFVVHRVDGSSTDFSFCSCITAPDSTALVRRAMRRAIADQTSEFKRASAARGPLVCCRNQSDAFVGRRSRRPRASGLCRTGRRLGGACRRLPCCADSPCGRRSTGPYSRRGCRR